MQNELLKSTFAACAALAAGALAAVPAVSGLSVQQSASSPLVTIAYTVSEEAVVTLKVETKNAAGEWTNVEKGVAHYVRGDMYRLVAAGEHVATWHPRAALGDKAFGADSCRVSVEAWAKDAPPDYMCVDLCFGGPVRYYPSADAVPLGVTNSLYLTDKMLFRRIPAKDVAWMMGANPAQAVVHGSASVYHEVRFTKDYYFGVYPVTRRQNFYVHGSTMTGSSLGKSVVGCWDEPYCPTSGMSFQFLRGTNLGVRWPVVSNDGVFDEAASHQVDSGCLIDKFRAKTGLQVDLPTEAQWEYACRAGAAEDFCNGCNLTKADLAYDAEGTVPPGTVDVCHAPSRYPAADGKHDTSNIRAIGVNQKKPNAWGIYSCHGNCFEICLDRYASGAAYSDGSAVTDPYGATAETGETDASGARLRSVRGGGAFNSVFNAISHKRGNLSETFQRADVSFRLAAPCEAR